MEFNKMDRMNMKLGLDLQLNDEKTSNPSATFRPSHCMKYIVTLTQVFKSDSLKICYPPMFPKKSSK